MGKNVLQSPTLGTINENPRVMISEIVHDKKRSLKIAVGLVIGLAIIASVVKK